MITPVSFEIAKLLKEKGFDSKKCIGYYTKEGEFFYFDVDDISSSYNSRLDNLIVNSIDPLYCLAPTIAEVVMWLYEKHGIWIYAKEEAENIWLYFYDNGVGYSSSDKSYTSPTEAYTKAIEYCLNELI